MIVSKLAASRTHAFKLGTKVFYRGPRQVAQSFTVVRLLPVERGGPQYSLRAESGQERVMDEALLTT